MWKYSILFVLMITSCYKKENMILAIDLQERSEYKNGLGENDTLPPLPPVSYYLDVNFMIDENGDTYLYKTDKPPISYSCGTGMVSDDIRPKFIDITPGQIEKVPDPDLKRIFHQNIKPRYNKGIFVLASARDTFYSVKWFGLMKELAKDKKTYWIWIVRKMTQEERIVLQHKRSARPYDPKAIAWDTTKIILPKALKK